MPLARQVSGEGPHSPNGTRPAPSPGWPGSRDPRCAFRTRLPSLSGPSVTWDKAPDRQEVRRAAAESLKAAAVGRSRLRLSEWAEGYEEAQGQIRCERRGLNNYFRKQGKRMPDRVSLPTGRYRRERMNPHQAPWEAIPDRRHSQEQEVVIWRRAEERMQSLRLPRGNSSIGGSGCRWGKCTSRRRGRSSGGREKPTQAAWKGRRNGPRWRRGPVVGASNFPTIPLSITGNSGASRIRSGWSRCGRSTESRLTRSGSGPGRGQACLWCPRGFRRTIGHSVGGRNTADRSGTLAPIAERLWVRPDPGSSGRKRVE